MHKSYQKYLKKKKEIIIKKGKIRDYNLKNKKKIIIKINYNLYSVSSQSSLVAGNLVNRRVNPTISTVSNPKTIN